VADVHFWVTELKGTLLGDTNLDFVVDGQDFIVWNEYKFSADARWTHGDFNADGVIDGLDFVIWNDNKFTSAGTLSVFDPGEEDKEAMTEAQNMPELVGDE
jgi:hypothetical protein